MSQDPTSSERRRSSLSVRPQVAPSIAGYHVLERLGAGRNGTVYRAIQLSMQREVALRVLNQRFSRIAGFPERFMQEARSASGVHHPNVVTCYDVGQTDGQLYLAMELVAGRTLSHVHTIHPQGLAVAHALSLVVAVTRGLEGIHRGGLMHGDLRLGNVFVTDDDAVKLADFGFQRSLEVMRDSSDELPDLATLAPEQVLTREPVDIRADLYGVGAIMYVLLTGRPPFVGRSRQKLVQAIRSTQVKDPQSLVADLSDDVAAVMAKAMARDPAQRYASPSQLREDLERVQHDFAPMHAVPFSSTSFAFGSDRKTSDEPGRRTSPTRTIAKDAGFLLLPRAEETRRAWPILQLTAGVGVVLLAGLVWWAWSSRSSPMVVADQAASVATPVQPLVNAPPWAAAAGQDAVGRWADLSVRGATLRLRLLPAGRFVMGTHDTDPAHRPDQKAVVVTFSNSWWLGDSEVTQAFYRAVCGNNPSAFIGDTLPVENVTWHEAVAFTQRLNALVPGLRARLPSEAEWEYACRAGSGVTQSTLGWFSSPDVITTRPVKGLPANPWGLHDQLGNVAEWCQDYYGPYPTQPVTDPLRFDGISRVVRGGSWAVDPSDGRSTTRGKYLPVAHHAHVGFRIAIEE